MIDIKSIPTKYYNEIIEVLVPVRFYFADDGFDGIEIGAFTEELQPWQEDMLERVCKAVVHGIGYKDGCTGS